MPLAEMTMAFGQQNLASNRKCVADAEEDEGSVVGCGCSLAENHVNNK
jgi:hypothetical protein